MMFILKELVWVRRVACSPLGSQVEALGLMWWSSSTPHFPEEAEGQKSCQSPHGSKGSVRWSDWYSLGLLRVIRLLLRWGRASVTLLLKNQWNKRLSFSSWMWCFWFVFCISRRPLSPTLRFWKHTPRKPRIMLMGTAPNTNPGSWLHGVSSGLCCWSGFISLSSSLRVSILLSP